MNISNIDNVKIGAFIAYVLIFLNSIYALVITPYILGMLGDIEFGIYKTIASLSSSLMILDLGIGGTLTRYIAKYRAEKKEKEIEPFISMMLSETALLIVIFTIICIILYKFLPSIYSTGLDSLHIKLAENLFIILSLNIGLHLIENFFYGIMSGYNKFAFSNGLKLGRIIIRIISTYVVLSIYKSSICLVIIDLILTIIIIVTDYIYIRRQLSVHIYLLTKELNNEIWYESFKYTMLMFLTSIASQVNSNFDNIVIGSILGASFVSIYSMALTIYVMFENLSTAISGVMLPTVTDALKDDATGNKVKDIVILTGRVQFILLGGVYGGFIVLGKDFVQLWLGARFEDVYLIALILITPSLLSLCINVCLSILKAKNMIAFRTYVMICVTFFNALTTVIGVKMFGYYVAAIATSLSVLLGSVIIMCIYYQRILSMNMIQIYGGIFYRSWICIITSSIFIYFTSRILYGTWLYLVLNVLLFIFIYALMLLLIGLKEPEINQFKCFFNKKAGN